MCNGTCNYQTDYMLALITVGISLLGLVAILDIIGILQGNPDEKVLMSVNLVPISFAIIVLALNIHC
jgi:hypothetical protein